MTSTKWWVGAAALGKTATHGRRHSGAVDIAGWRACRCRSAPFLRPVEIAWCVRFLGRLVLWSHTASFFCVSVSDDHGALPGIELGDIGALISMRKNT